MDTNQDRLHLPDCLTMTCHHCGKKNIRYGGYCNRKGNYFDEMKAENTNSNGKLGGGTNGKC